jgi:ElaA protein
VTAWSRKVESAAWQQADFDHRRVKTVEADGLERIGSAWACAALRHHRGMSDITWRACRFDDLSPRELQYIYMARQQVFAIEQNCVYLDVDGYDEPAWHVAAWSSAQRVPLAYARLIDPGHKYAEPSMGRVITTGSARGTGLGRELVRRVIALAGREHPGHGVRIGAQSRLERFYEEAGFVIVGARYMEDGIPHTEMLLSPRAAAAA